MKIRSKIFSNGDIKKLGKRLEVLALGTLCPKISFVAQKLRALGREQTHRHTEKTKLRDPFFLQFIFFLVLLG